MDRLEKIRCWQWLLIAVVVGLCIGWSRSAWITRAGAFGDTLNNQLQFERGLDRNVRNEAKFHVDSVFMFEGPADDGTPHKFHAVRGTLESWNPRSNSMTRHVVTFVAPVPFHPKRLEELNTNPTAASAISGFSALKEPTVIDYLNVLATGQGISFGNAWWDTHPYWTWLTASVLLIGLTVPALINLNLFGTIIRPREEKGTSLWSVDNPKKAKEPEASLPDGDALLNEKLAEMENDLEQSLPAEPERLKPPEPMRILVGSPSAPEILTHDVSSKEFGANKDDFYPTEQKAKKHLEKPAARQ